MKTKFVPIYEKDGNHFFFRYEELVAVTEKEARALGVTKKIPVFFTDAEFTGEVMECDPDNMSFHPATLGGFSIGLISGPLLDRAAKAGHRQTSSIQGENENEKENG